LGENRGDEVDVFKHQHSDNHSRNDSDINLNKKELNNSFCFVNNKNEFLKNNLPNNKIISSNFEETMFMSINE
jgi:hypothetical protein